MEIKKETLLPKEDEAFFNDIVDVFKKHPGMNKLYFISSLKPYKKLYELMKEGQKIRTSWDGNKIITEIVDFSVHPETCYKWGVDDNGNAYCLESD